MYPTPVCLEIRLGAGRSTLSGFSCSADIPAICQTHFETALENQPVRRSSEGVHRFQTFQHTHNGLLVEMSLRILDT
jgi:hypothetical protein